MERKNTHVLSSDLRKWKENGKKNIQVLSAVLSKWEKNINVLSSDLTK
jgi:hypothetical protein